MFLKRNRELKRAFEKRLEAKNNFVEKANEKKSIKELLGFYKKYDEANRKLIEEYEKVKYEKAA